tara:strand:+ start:90 stop:434 length:345 start_codon:yes stop_codon:yes gene_type:complete
VRERRRIIAAFAATLELCKMSPWFKSWLFRHEGPIIIEGPFVRNRCFLLMLSYATGCDVKAMDSATGTSAGAALLASLNSKKNWISNKQIYIAPPLFSDLLKLYTKQWRHAVLD